MLVGDSTINNVIAKKKSPFDSSRGDRAIPTNRPSLTTTWKSSVTNKQCYVVTSKTHLVSNDNKAEASISNSSVGFKELCDILEHMSSELVDKVINNMMTHWLYSQKIVDHVGHRCPLIYQNFILSLRPTLANCWFFWMKELYRLMGKHLLSTTTSRSHIQVFHAAQSGHPGVVQI